MFNFTPLSHSAEYWWVQQSLHVSFVGETFLYFLFDLSGLCCVRSTEWVDKQLHLWADFLPLSFSVRKNNNATLLQQTYIPQTWVKTYGKKKKLFRDYRQISVSISCLNWKMLEHNQTLLIKNTNPVQCDHNVWCSLLTFRIGSQHLLSNNNKKPPMRLATHVSCRLSCSVLPLCLYKPENIHRVDYLPIWKRYIL